MYPIALQRLLPLVGFAWSTRILGFMALFTFVIGIGLVLWHSGNKFAPKKPRSFLDASALKEKPFVVFCFAIFFIFLAYYIPFFYIPDYAQASVGASFDWSVPPRDNERRNLPHPHYFRIGGAEDRTIEHAVCMHGSIDCRFVRMVRSPYTCGTRRLGDLLGIHGWSIGYDACGGCSSTLARSGVNRYAYGNDLAVRCNG